MDLNEIEAALESHDRNGDLNANVRALCGMLLLDARGWRRALEEHRRLCLGEDGMGGDFHDWEQASRRLWTLLG